MAGISSAITERHFQVLLPFLIALFFAPIAFGGTTLSACLVIDGLLLGTFCLWLALLIVEKRRPALSKWMVASGLFVILLGAAHLANPKYEFLAETWSLLPVASAIPYLPGTVDAFTSGPPVRHAISLFLLLVVVTDLSRDRRVRWWLLTAIALSGFVTAMLGIYQKAGNAEAMLWATPEQSGHLFFGAFRYHANAGSFLNLCWPAAFALWLRACHQPGSGLWRSFWFIVLVFSFLAVFVNTSKGGHLIGLGLFAISVIRYRKQIFWEERNWKAASVSIAVVVGVGAVGILPGILGLWSQWSEAVKVGDGIAGRWFVYGACLEAVKESGIWGRGPGTFRLVFPFYTGGEAGGVSGIWIHSHEDALQCLIEWGWLGFTAIVFLLFGGLWKGFLQIRRAAEERRLELSASAAVIGLIGVIIHSLIDFPFQIPAVQLPVLVYLGCFWRNLTGTREVARKRKNARMHHAGVPFKGRVPESV